MPRVRARYSRLCPLLVSLVLSFACERNQSPPADAPEPAPTPSGPTPAETPADEAEPEPQTPQPEIRTSPPDPASELPEVAGLAYLEVVTGNADPEAELPMIVAFHGNTAYPGLMAWALLDDGGPASAPAPPFGQAARFIFPPGVDAYGAPGHARWFSVTANEAQSEPDAMSKLCTQIEAVTDEVAAALTKLAATRPTRGKPIITGHSQGGILTFALAIRHPEAFAAAVPAAGWLPKPLWPTQKASGPAATCELVSLHGDADTVVNYEVTREGIEHLRGLGYPIRAIDYPGVGHSFGPLLANLRRELETLAKAE